MRSDLEAYKFDKDKWSTELSPILNLWKKLNQVSQLVLASFCFVFVFSFVCFLFSVLVRVTCGRAAPSSSRCKLK